LPKKTKLLVVKAAAGKRQKELIGAIAEAGRTQSERRGPAKKLDLSIQPIRMDLQRAIKESQERRLVVENGNGLKKRKWIEIHNVEDGIVVKFVYESEKNCITKIKKVPYPAPGAPLIVEEDM
jgi:predicted phosphoribosyltransferase